MLRRQITLAMLCTLIGLAGCSGILSKPYPEKVRYALATPLPEAKPAGALAPLRVSLLRVSQPYDSVSLVYRTGTSTYSSDYYKTFVATPDRLLTAEVVNYLCRTGQFSVVSLGVTGDARYILEGDLLSMYGDFRKGAPPAAEMSIRFFLIDDANAAANVILQKTYQASQPIPSTSTEDLVEGWNKAMGTIMGQLTSDIGAATAPKLTTSATH